MEYKIVVTGTAAVGKTTAITSLSDNPPVTTDQEATDDLAEIKATTTVAFDFGEIILDDDTIVRVYGTPGQERFRHMWEIIAEGAMGFIILVDATRPDPVADLDIYVTNFAQFIADTTTVIGITRGDGVPDCSDALYDYLEKNNLAFPIMPVDPRDKSDMTELMLSLLAMLECH